MPIRNIIPKLLGNFDSRTQWKPIAMFLGIVAAIIATLLLVQYLFSPPTVISLSIQNGQQQVDPLTPLVITFSRNVNHTNITIQARPDAQFKVERTNGRTISATPTLPLHTNTWYDLTVLYKRKELAAVRFSTIKSQSDPTILNEIQEWTDANYPLQSVLPKKTATYELFYVKAKTLGIYKLATNISDEEILAEVRAFIESNGVNSTSHTISFLPPSSPSNPSTIMKITE